MKEKIIKIIKRVIIDIIIIFWILFWLSLIFFAPASYPYELYKARDISAIALWNEIVEHLESLESYEFDNIVDYNDKYKWMRPYKNCYYLSPTEDRKDYILVQPLESKKYKKKMWGEFILHMSNPNYLITSQRWKEIMRVINDRCENIYK
jgi:hypothetical protein